MAEITLVAESARATGTSNSKRLRSAGRIPAVVYGGGMDALSVSVDARQLRQALTGESGVNQLLSLHVDDQRHLTLARVIQRHPVRNTVIHVDFQVVRRDEVVSADVAIVLVGEAKHVEQERGLIEHPLQMLTVNAVPANIPREFVVDISELVIGETVRVSDLTLPVGVTTDIDLEEPVVVASTSAAAEADEDVAEGEGDAGSEEASPAGED